MKNDAVQHVQSVVHMLDAEGVGLWVTVAQIGGSKTFQLMPDDVVLYLEDRRSWTAKQWGVTLDQLDEWERRDGSPLCGGITKTGRPCGSRLTSQLNPPGFISWHRQYLCHTHSEQ